MNTEKIIEGNKLIAEFMGIKTKVYSDRPTITRWKYGNSMLYETDLKYHSSWDWLMPVIYKIESFGFSATILDVGMCIAGKLIIERFGESKIEGTYYTIIEFIKWYNQQYNQQQP